VRVRWAYGTLTHYFPLIRPRCSSNLSFLDTPQGKLHLQGADNEAAWPELVCKWLLVSKRPIDAQHALGHIR
jgi:hypothetical protein